MSNQPATPPPFVGLDPPPRPKRSGKPIAIAVVAVGAIALLAIPIVWYAIPDDADVAEGLIREMWGHRNPDFVRKSAGQTARARGPHVVQAELAELGASAVPAIVEAIRNRGPQGLTVRSSSPLDFMSPESPVEYRCRILVDVLGEMGPSAARAVPDLTEWVTGNRVGLRRSAIIALGRIGPDAAPAVPALLKLCDRQITERSGRSSFTAHNLLADLILETCGQIGPKAVDATPRIIARVKLDRFHISDEKMESMVAALAGIGPKAIVHLDPLMTEEPTNARRLAYRAMARMGPEGLDALIRHLHGRHRRARIAAALGLKELGPMSAPAIAQILSAAGDPTNITISRETVAASVTTILFDVLTDIGPPAEEGLQEIATHNKNNLLRDCARMALETVRTGNP